MIAMPLIMAAELLLRIPATMASGASTEAAVLVELNRARTDPAAFVQSLKVQRGWYRGNLLERPGADAVYLTEEGVRPVDEAIAFVARERSKAPLFPTPVLTAAAVDHQAEQRDTGTVGHVGPDGSTPSERVRRRGGGIYVGEVIAYGSTDPADIVRQLIVDDGVADRGHRRLLFDPSLGFAGVSCGPHPVYRYSCVVTLARTPDGEAIRRGTGRTF